jgi:hypothetical protein
MVRTRVETRVDRDASGAVRSATDRHMLDVAQAGFNKSQDVILDEATDTGQLERSGFAPRRRDDGTVVYGWSADYAAAVDQGTVPHWPPIKPLLGWVRRVFGVDGSRKWAAAKGVQQKIAEEGTAPVGFVEHGLEAARAKARERGLDKLVSERL